MRKHKITNEECFEILAGYHNDWVAMALSIMSDGDNVPLAHEIVHRVYDKLVKYDKMHKCVNTDKTISKSYVYLTILSTTYDYYNDLNKERDNFLIFSDDLEGEYDQEDTNAKNEACGIVADKMNHYLDTEFTWVDRQIFKLYHDSGLSMQKLSDDSGIAKTSIYGAVRRVKARLKELLREDYEDLKNQDYEYIKPLKDE